MGKTRRRLKYFKYTHPGFRKAASVSAKLVLLPFYILHRIKNRRKRESIPSAFDRAFLEQTVNEKARMTGYNLELRSQRMKRRLSLSSSPEPKKKPQSFWSSLGKNGVTRDQSRSRLMGLPGELRTLIWEFVVAFPDRVDIELDSDRNHKFVWLKTVRCAHPDDLSHRHGSCTYRAKTEAKQHGILPLLQSCRSM